MSSKDPFERAIAMSPEGEMKRDKMVDGWGVKARTSKGSNKLFRKNIDAGYVPDEEKKHKVYIPLEDFVKRLEQMRLVKNVYVVDDTREELGSVSILLKLHNLGSFSPEELELGNGTITNFLETFLVEDSYQSIISFQYTEVYE